MWGWNFSLDSFNIKNLAYVCIDITIRRVLLELYLAQIVPTSSDVVGEKKTFFLVSSIQFKIKKPL